MVTRIIDSEISPQLEAWFGRSWQKLLGIGLGFVLIGILVLVLPRLVAALIAIALFLIALVFFITAYRFWKISRPGESPKIPVD